MSDSSRPTAGAGAEPIGRGSAVRLINPTVRDYMEAVNLARFYGGYQVQHLAEHVLNLGIGEVGNIPLPEDVYSVYQRFLQAPDWQRLAVRYGGTLGEHDTNAAEAAAMNAWLGEDRFTEHVVVSLDGGQNAVEVAIRVFTSPVGSAASRKQYVLLAQPCYPYMSAIVASHAGAMSFLAYDAEQFTRGVEQYCNASVGAILVNVPHNPMGYALSAEQVARIDAVARIHDCAIIVDAVYGNYPADPAVGHVLAGFDPERTVFCDSFSKKFGLPGLRLGFALCTAPELTYALRFVKVSESLTPSNVKLAFAGHMLTEHSDVPTQIGAVVRDRRARFLERFQAAAVPGVRVLQQEGNPFYQALDISGLCKHTGLTDTEVTQFCLEHYQVRVFPGSFVYPNAALDHASFTGAGRHNPHGRTAYLPPSFEAGARVVYAPGTLAERRALLRLSFGTEPRVEAAAEALAGALNALWQRR